MVRFLDDFRVGRESRTGTGEDLATESGDKLVMGTSVQWYADEEKEASTFPDCPWAVRFDLRQGPARRLGLGDRRDARSGCRDRADPRLRPPRRLRELGRSEEMAGRAISVTHVALGTVRVMRTGGMMGEVVGMAASLCTKHGTTPRGVYERHLDELKQRMARGVGREASPN